MNTIKVTRKSGIIGFSFQESNLFGGKNMNFFNRKNQKKIAGAICIIVILAMVIPIVLGSM